MNVTSHPVPPYFVLILPSHLRLDFRSEDAKIIVVGKLEGKRQLGRPRRVWNYDIEMEIKQDGRARSGMKLALDRNKWRAVLITVMNHRVS